LRFENSLNDKKISLEEYTKLMAKDQKEIYYFANTDKNHIKNSPQLEVFTDKKIPVLFMVDAVDEFWIQNVNKFKDVEFKSISKGKVDLSKVGEKSNKKDENKKEIVSKINDLINVLKNELKDKISNVIISDRLTKSPILLVAEESAMDINMEKLMSIALSSATNNIGLLVNLSDIITFDILSLSSFFKTLIKSLILLTISFLFSSFLFDFSPTFERSTLPFDIDLNSTSLNLFTFCIQNSSTASTINNTGIFLSVKTSN
jgi:HSP90 family molecular chaperone